MWLWFVGVCGFWVCVLGFVCWLVWVCWCFWLCSEGFSVHLYVGFGGCGCECMLGVCFVFFLFVVVGAFWVHNNFLGTVGFDVFLVRFACWVAGWLCWLPQAVSTICSLAPNTGTSVVQIFAYTPSINTTCIKKRGNPSGFLVKLTAT